MAVVDVDRHHQDLVDELIAAVEEYNPGVDKELLARAFRFAATAHDGQTRSSGEPFVHHPWAVAKICAELHLDEQSLVAALLHDVVEDTETEPDDVRAEFGDEIAQLVEGVTKLTRTSFQTREQSDAENFRKMIVAMAQDVRVILIKLADRLHNMRTIEYQGKQAQVRKAKETLEVYAPLAHRLGINAMKWELEDLLVRDPAPAQVRRDQGDGRRPARRPGGRGREGERRARRRAGQGRHPRGDRGPREALLFDLRQDGQEGPRVQRDLRPDRDARHRRARRRRGDARLLRRARPDPLALEADARAVQGLHRDAEVQPLPVAAHDRDRARGDAARDPGADARDARGGGVRDRRPLALQARQGQAGRRVADVGQVAAGLAAGRGRPARVHEDVPHRPLRRRGLRLHAEGRGEDAAAGRDADRLRLRRPHRRRPQDGRREDQRPHRPAPLPAQERRLRRDPDLEVGSRPVARLDEPRGVLARPEQDPAVVPARDAGRDRGQGTRAARPRAEGAEPALQEAAGLRGAGAGDPRDRLPQGRGLLRRARREQAADEPDRQQGPAAAEDGGGRRGGDHPAEAVEAALDRRRRQPRDQGAGDRRRARPDGEVLHAGARATGSSATSRSAAGSRSTARTART